MKTFTMTDDQEAKLNEWLEEIHEERLRINYDRLKENEYREGFADDMTNNGSSLYLGAAGGGVLYTFYPTSVGTTLIVIDTITRQELNLTDYDSW